MKVLVTASFTDDGIKRLANLGMEVIYEPWSRRGKLMLSEELAERIKDVGAQAVIIEVDLCHDEVFEECELRFIGCCRGDPLIVDLDEATDRKVPVFFTPGRNADAVADLTVAFMLCLLRKIVPIHNSVVSGGFNPETPEEFMNMFNAELKGDELGGKTVGIVGLGAVGAAVAARLAGFGSPMLAYDPFAPEERFARAGANKTSLEELFREADIVTIHAADLDENRGMITRALIDSMKPDALFLNLARHALVDGDALYDALKNGKIAGAGLDVFEHEPPTSDDRFAGLDNVIITPHLGGNTRDVVRHQTDMVVDDIEAFLTGGRPRFCANPEVLEKGD